MSVSRAAATLVLATAFLAGCHHKQTAVYIPPSPPAPVSQPSRPATISLPPKLSSPSPSVIKTDRSPDLVETGLASWYGPPYHNHPGADGTIYDQNALTAAHKTLPLGSVVRVTNLGNNSAVEVRITDRGPFVGDRLIDLSLAAAQAIDVYRPGIARVRVEAFLPTPKPGADPNGRWCVQIGAFLNAEDAVQLKNDLLRRYTTAKVTEFQGPTGFWVRINPRFPTRSVATEVAAAIHVPDAQAFLVRTD